MAKGYESRKLWFVFYIQQKLPAVLVVVQTQIVHTSPFLVFDIILG